MLKLLPSLPFRCAFDILFLYEGFAHVEAVMGQRFLERWSDSCPLWMDLVAACHIVMRLAHPAHALYLLHPIDADNQDSVSAWRVWRRAPTTRQESLIRAMMCFLTDALPFQLYPFLDLSELRQIRTLGEWRALASETVANHAFTRRWWKSDACHLDGERMAEAIFNLTKGEQQRLEGAMHSAERIRVLCAKRATWNRLQKPLRLTIHDTQCIREEAERQYALHKRLLTEVETILKNIHGFELDDQFQRIARIVANLAKEYPKIKSSLRLLFHSVAIYTLGFDVWQCERELPVCRKGNRKRLRDDPLQALRNVQNQTSAKGAMDSGNSGCA